MFARRLLRPVLAAGAAAALAATTGLIPAQAQLDALAQVPAARSVWGVGSPLPFPKNPQGIFQGVILQDGP